MAVADSTSNTILLLINDGEGRFTPGGTFPVGQRPVLLLAADLDGDRLTELVSGNADGNRDPADRDDLSVVFGSGDGFFAPEIRLEVANEPFDLATGDLDNDGLLVLVMSPGTDVGDVSLWLGAPARGFLPAPVTTSLLRPRHVAVEDLNGDGIPDLLLGGFGLLQVLLGLGDSTFVQEHTYSVQFGALTFADWNSDGRLDIAIAGGQGISLLQNQGPFPPVSVPVRVISRGPDSRQQIRTRGVIVMDIQSTAEVDASHILPESISLGGAPVRQAGGSGRFLCQAVPAEKNTQTNLHCEVEAAAVTSGPGGIVLLEGFMDDGRRIKGETALNLQ